MAKLTWDNIGEKIYETGVSNGVIYPQIADGTYPSGVAWNGLANVSESPSGAEASPIYADNIKYLNLISAEEFGATVEAYYYPEEFKQCDGSKEVAPGVYAGQQNRIPFGMVYKTLIGNDTKNTDYGYKLHLIYNALAAPSEKGYSSVNDNPEAISFSWTLNTTPVPVNIDNVKPTATLEIDSTKTTPAKLKALEDILFGTEETEARLPLPAEVISLLSDSGNGVA